MLGGSWVAAAGATRRQHISWLLMTLVIKKKRETRNPKPETLNPKPLNPKP